MLVSLAPQRRRLLVGGAGAAIVALVAAIVLLAAGGRTRARIVPVVQSRPGPVLLVPGYGEDGGGLDALSARVRAAGRRVTIVDLPGNATGDLTAQARALRAAVTGALKNGKAPSVDLVGYSDGGVVARIYVRDLGGGSTVRRVVTLGSPQHGTGLASSAEAILPSACRGACAQLRPGSDLLSHLNSGNETPPGPRWVSLWTTQDEVVTPPSSARLAGAENIVLQHVCPDEHVSHGGLPSDPLVTGIVLTSIGPGRPVAPRPGQCAALRRAGAA